MLCACSCRSCSGVTLLQSERIILAFPGTRSAGNPAVLFLWLPWEQLPAVLLFLSLFPGKALAVAAEKSNEVLDLGFIFPLCTVTLVAGKVMILMCLKELENGIIGI